MSETSTESVTELEELLDAEIPCGGIKYGAIARTCSSPAVLRGKGHGCEPSTPAMNKCVPCWQIWFQNTANTLARHGRLDCLVCHRIFHSVEDFNDFRPF